MKKVIITFFAIAFISTSAFSQFKVGAGANYLFDGSLFGLSGKAHYTVNEQFAGQVSFSYFFEDFTVWNLDLDVHYNGFQIGDLEGFRLTPFAGLNVFRTSVTLGNITSGDTDINLNLGMNGTVPITETLDLYIEPKFILGDGSTFALAAGVYF